MFFKLFIVLFAVHFGLSLAGWFGVNTWALAAADAGSTAAGIDAAAAVVRFGLLQPLAYWVLDAGDLAWWTWRGLLLLGVLLACNSVIVAGVATGCWRGFLKARASTG